MTLLPAFVGTDPGLEEHPDRLAFVDHVPRPAEMVPWGGGRVDVELDQALAALRGVVAGVVPAAEAGSHASIAGGLPPTRSDTRRLFDTVARKPGHQSRRP